MACLCCQRQFAEHNHLELVKCIIWIQEQHHIRSEQVRQVAERAEYLKKYGKNIYKSTINLNDIIKELEVQIRTRNTKSIPKQQKIKNVNEVKK